MDRLDKTRRVQFKGPIYCFPHRGVYRPEKVSTPLRVVFDPACLHQGVSLNSSVYEGPILIGNLFSVHLHFREDLVAIVGDISKMFLQVMLKPEDTEVHGFLSRNLDSSGEPDVYRMRVGEKPSPAMVSFVMLLIAKKFRIAHPEASLILQHGRYLDDLIHSCPPVAHATQLTSYVDRILKDGSSVVDKWYYSSAEGQEGFQWSRR